MQSPTPPPGAGRPGPAGAPAPGPPGAAAARRAGRRVGTATVAVAAPESSGARRTSVQPTAMPAASVARTAHTADRPLGTVTSNDTRTRRGSEASTLTCPTETDARLRPVTA